jgi:hypothetical protein
MNANSDAVNKKSDPFDVGVCPSSACSSLSRSCSSNAARKVSGSPSPKCEEPPASTAGFLSVTSLDEPSVASPAFADPCMSASPSSLFCKCAPSNCFKNDASARWESAEGLFRATCSSFPRRFLANSALLGSLQSANQCELELHALQVVTRPSLPMGFFSPFPLAGRVRQGCLQKGS